MSIALMAHVWQHSPQKGTKLLLLLAMADLADDHGLYLSTEATLSKRIRMSEQQVIRLVHELENENAILIRRKPHAANQYAILSPWIK